jgi:hypothetical protein
VVSDDVPRTYLCANKPDLEGCPCCVGLPPPSKLNPGQFHVQMVGQNDRLVDVQADARHMLDALPGCGEAYNGGWNEFWD